MLIAFVNRIVKQVSVMASLKSNFIKIPGKRTLISFRIEHCDLLVIYLEENMEIQGGKI